MTQCWGAAPRSALSQIYPLQGENVRVMSAVLKPWISVIPDRCTFHTSLPPTDSEAVVFSTSPGCSISGCPDRALTFYNFSKLLRNKWRDFQLFLQPNLVMKFIDFWLEDALLYFSQRPSRLLHLKSYKHVLIILLVQFQVLLPSRPCWKSPNSSLFRKAWVYLSWAVLSFITQSLWFTPIPALTNIWPRILLMHLEFKAGLAGNNLTTSSLSAAICDKNPDHHPLLRCPRHTLAELSRYRGQARRRGSAGVLGALRRKHGGSCCLFSAVLLGRCFIYNTDAHSLLSSDSQNEEACAGGGEV